MATSLTPESLQELVFVSDPQLSPDGRHAAAVHTHIVPPEEEDKHPRYRGYIVLYDLGGGEPRPFTDRESSAKSPRFSPDGTQLAFLRSRGEDDKPQVHVISLSGGEARKLTEFKAGVSEFAWHPDGKRIFLVSRGDWQDESAKKGEARRVDRMHYKADGTGFRPTEVAQIHVCNAETGDSERISDLQSDPSGIILSPDGHTIYFSGARDPREDDLWHSNIWAQPLEGGQARALIENLHMASTPSPSPDGRWVAFLAPVLDENFASPTGLWLAPSAGGEARLLTGDADVTQSIGGDSRYGAYPNRPLWTEDGKLLVNFNRNGRSGPAEVDPENGELRPLAEADRAVTAFAAEANKIAFIAETPSRPGELFLLEDGRERGLSRANQAFLDRFELAEAAQEHSVSAESGPAISYWTLSPVRARADAALVLEVHGGPHTNYGYGFYFEFQLLATRGYAVVYGNPRGSSAYGTDFATSMLGRYGSIDADDIMAIAHHARAHHSAPEAPIHLTGGSYGGFMTNWLVGHTDEFRSAVTQRSISNWLSFFGVSDIGYHFAPLEVAGNPWADLEKLWDQSPIKYVADVKTPLLILHSEEDHRCPIEQAEQFYIALKCLDKAPTELLRFPGEGHELSRSGRPDRRIRRLEAIVGWFEQHA